MRLDLKTFIALAIGGFLAGCAHPASVREAAISPETAPSYARVAPLTGMIAVGTVSSAGMSRALQNPAYTSMSRTIFEKALMESLQTSKLAAASDTSAYTLNAVITKIETPWSLSSDIVTNVDIAYTLIRNNDGKEIFSEPISSSYTSTKGDSILADVRRDKSRNGSFRKNIEQLIEKLYDLKMQ